MADRCTCFSVEEPDSDCPVHRFENDPFPQDGIAARVVAPIVPWEQFREDLLATVRGERPAPPYAGKTVYASQKARDDAASNDENGGQ